MGNEEKSRYTLNRNNKNNNMSKKINNGQLNSEQENMRLQVIDLELKARYWKAQFEIRHYTLQAESIQPEYDKYMEEQKAMFENNMKELQAKLEEQAKMAEEGKIEIQTQD